VRVRASYGSRWIHPVSATGRRRGRHLVPRSRSWRKKSSSSCMSCSGLKSSSRRGRGRGASSRAPRFVSTNRWRVRATGAIPTSNAAAIASSLSLSAALSRMRARVSLWAPVLPLQSRCSKVARSAALQSTTYFFLGMAGDSSHEWYPDCTGGSCIDQIYTDRVLGRVSLFDGWTILIFYKLR